LLFGEALFELEGNHGFGHFAAPGALIAEEESARDLHGDGAGALKVRAGVAQVGPRGTHDAHEIEAAVLEEALVFRGENSVNENAREVVVAHRAALSRALSKRLVMSSGSISAVSRVLPPPRGRMARMALPVN